MDGPSSDAADAGDAPDAGPAYLFHDPVAARSALSDLDRTGLAPAQVVHAPERVVFGPDRTDQEVRAGLWGLVVGVVALVLVTLASVAFLGGGEIGVGVLALVLYHGALIGAIVGFAYGVALRHLTFDPPERDVVLHGDDVLVRAGTGPAGRRVRAVLERYGAERIPGATAGPEA